MEIDNKKVAFAIAVISEIIKDGERYYIDDWTNALHYTKNILESHLSGEVVKPIKSPTVTVSPYIDNEDHPSDNIQW